MNEEGGVDCEAPKQGNLSRQHLGAKALGQGGAWTFEEQRGAGHSGAKGRAGWVSGTGGSGQSGV